MPFVIDFTKGLRPPGRESGVELRAVALGLWVLAGLQLLAIDARAVARLVDIDRVHRTKSHRDVFLGSRIDIAKNPALRGAVISDLQVEIAPVGMQAVLRGFEAPAPFQ